MKRITIKLSDLKVGKNTFSVSSLSDELELGDIEFPVVGSIETDIVIYRNRENYTMTLKTTFKLKLTCSRCLKEYDDPFVEIAEFQLKPQHALQVKEDPYLIGYHGDEIDIAPLIREQVILSLPMKPLCSDTCEVPKYDKGDDAVDERWKELLKLKEKLK